MNQHSEAIDQKEIRGINAKHVVWLIVSLCTILVSIMGTYYSTANKIDSMQKDMNSLSVSKEIQDAQIKALNLNLQQLELRIVKLETQVVISSMPKSAL